MDRIRTVLAGLAAASMALALVVGCAKDEPSTPRQAKKKPEEKPSASETAKSKPAESKTDKPAPEPKEKEEAKPQVVVVEPVKTSGDGLLAKGPMDDEVAEMPTVVMSEQHAATCLVKVGDSVASVNLKDLAGAEQDLSKLLGDRFTVLVFWRSDDPHGLAEVRDLAVDFASPLAARGVKVVGVCEQGTAAAAKSAAEKQGVAFPVLIDNDGKFLAQLATSKLPRTYLLDPSGKVLWLDIEYSRSTRHDLRQALRSLLASEQPAS